MTEDLADEAVTGDEIEDGAVGLNVERRLGNEIVLDPGVASDSSVICDDDEVLVGGGFTADAPVFHIQSLNPEDNEWTVSGQNVGNEEVTFQAIALCAQITS
jgi:hypothetical protein